MIMLHLFAAHMAFASPIQPTPFPVFLKEGFSTILEFEEAPSQVVLGDSKSFQIENLNRSIVIKPLAPYATTNMFVYFKSKEARLFILSASEEAEPTYYKKFGTLKPANPKAPEKAMAPRQQLKRLSRGASVTNVQFDDKKDYLTVDVAITAGADGKIVPSWELVRLRHKSRTISPLKLWSERREAQKDSEIKARFVFTKPNVPVDLNDVVLLIPVKGAKALSLSLKRSRS